MYEDANLNVSNFPDYFSFLPDKLLFILNMHISLLTSYLSIVDGWNWYSFWFYIYKFTISLLFYGFSEFILILFFCFWNADSCAVDMPAFSLFWIFRLGNFYLIAYLSSAFTFIFVDFYWNFRSWFDYFISFLQLWGNNWSMKCLFFSSENPSRLIWGAWLIF